jgi:CDP-alcohol phosphatidyltransferase
VALPAQSIGFFVLYVTSTVAGLAEVMSKPQDGFVSRVLNRAISRRITHLLLKFPVHPNAWTIAIFALPLIAFFIRGNYLSIVIGAAIFQVFSILDGCDGEIARAKNLESKFGERLDYFCDFIASLLYVLALRGTDLWRLSQIPQVRIKLFRRVSQRVFTSDCRPLRLCGLSL